MRKIAVQKKVVMGFIAGLLLIFFAAIFLCVPRIAGAESVGSSDLATFNAAFSRMLEYSSNANEVEAQTVALTDIQPQETPLNRLIVNDFGGVCDYGAALKAEYQNWHIFQYDSAQSADYAYAQLKNLGLDVCYDQYVYCNDFETVEADNTQTGQYNSWGNKYVGYDDYVDTLLTLYDNENNLNKVVVAVLDSGINRDHKLFTDRILSEYAQNFTKETASTYSYVDYFGHGTHVSGTIAEATMSNVQILPMKVLNREGRGEVGMIINAIEKLIELKKSGINIVVFNMSIGVEDNGSGYSENSALSSAVIEAYQNGIIPVVSAGNESRNTKYACPANVDEAITVSALADRNGQVVFDASYSNYGQFVDFSAPGTSIFSAGIEGSQSLAVMSGTSMAAPHVTAAVALVLSNPSFTNYNQSQVYNLLKRNAIDCGESGFDELYGWGCINVAKIGVESGGVITFSDTQKFHDQAFTLKLSFDEAKFSGDVNIYYTTNNTEESVPRLSRTLYNDSKGIEISSTTKITAFAYVVNKTTQRLQRSNVCSFTYYLNNQDLLENYTFRHIGAGEYISGYSGTELTTLVLPKETRQGVKVIGIYANAFLNSHVENFILPNTIQNISASAFNGNTSIKSISCSSANVEIGDYAFYKCSNLESVNIENIIKVGAYGFAYCTNLKSLNLMQAHNIDKHAFSGSGIAELKLGKGLQTFEGDQSVDQLDTVYGFAGESSPAETFANSKDVDFVDLTLKLASDAPTEIILKDHETNAKASTFSVLFVGVDVRYSTTLTSGEQSFASNVTGNISAEGYSGRLNLCLNGLEVGEYLLTVSLFDSFEETTTFQVQVKVVADDVFVVSSQGSNFDLFIDDILLQDVVVENQLVKAEKNLIGEHTIVITPENGYAFSKISVNGQEQTLRNNNQFVYTFNGTTDVSFDITSVAKPFLSVTFDTQSHGNIKLTEGSLADDNSLEVDRNSSLQFTVQEQPGYLLKRVLFNGKRISADENGVYTVSNITIDSSIVALFEQRYYKVKVSLGKGGNLITTGGAEDSDIAFGASRVYQISVSDGYELNFVTINGENVEVVNGQFVLENVTEDCLIVVSFKQVQKSIFSGGSVFLVYGFIFLAIMFVFVLAKIILTEVRKHKKEEK